MHPGDIGCRTWTCTDCRGTGYNPHHEPRKGALIQVHFFGPDPSRPDGGNFLKLIYDRGVVTFVRRENVETFGDWK